MISASVRNVGQEPTTPMATIQSSRAHPSSRLRSSSDPFVDPSPRSKPPPPPPKNKPSRMPTAPPKSAPASNSTTDITEAVRNTVTVRTQQDSSRPKASRAQTTATTVTSSRPAGHRSQSDDTTNAQDKSRSSGKSRSKKGSQHADVIDRLDFTGVGPMFHHDGPFDACAPSRNKHRNKAPMFAWEDPNSQSYGDSAYPSADAYKAFSNNYPEPPKKKVDAIAEAWGMHEPEPFEEFFAGGGSGRPDGDTPASSIYNGMDSHNSNSTSRSGAAKRTKDSREDRESRPRAAARRSLLPPPQPIFVSEPMELDLPDSPPPSSPSFPKRTKSLMHRIRRMRDAPNVPVAPDYEQPPSPSSPTDSTTTRPTHKSQNSFLGRFGAASRANQPVIRESSGDTEPYVYIEPHNNKELPAPPPLAASASAPEESRPSQDSFDGKPAGVASSPGGLGRKTSLMKKVGRVVRGGGPN